MMDCPFWDTQYLFEYDSCKPLCARSSKNPNNEQFQPRRRKLRQEKCNNPFMM